MLHTANILQPRIFFSLVCCKHSFTQLSIHQNSISTMHSRMGREEASQEILDFINIAQITHFAFFYMDTSLIMIFFSHCVIHNTFIQLNLLILVFKANKKWTFSKRHWRLHVQCFGTARAAAAKCAFPKCAWGAKANKVTSVPKLGQCQLMLRYRESTILHIQCS